MKLKSILIDNCSRVIARSVFCDEVIHASANWIASTCKKHRFRNDMGRVVTLIVCLLLSITKVFAEVPILDNATTSIVKNNIASQPMLAKSNVTVTTNNGIVKIEGTVKTENEAIMLIQTAQSANGVKDVDTSNLKVEQSKQPFTDMVITAKIKGLLLRSKLFGNPGLRSTVIDVSTNNGIVSLSGVVSKPEQIMIAISIAKSVSGVKNVESMIKVVK